VYLHARVRAPDSAGEIDDNMYAGARHTKIQAPEYSLRDAFVSYKRDSFKHNLNACISCNNLNRKRNINRESARARRSRDDRNWRATNFPSRLYKIRDELNRINQNIAIVRRRRPRRRGQRIKQRRSLLLFQPPSPWNR